jgi:hypothetical protein
MMPTVVVVQSDVQPFGPPDHANGLVSLRIVIVPRFETSRRR